MSAPEALKEDPDIAFGTLHYDAPDRPGGHAEVSGWITTGMFEETDEPAAVVITTADTTRDGEPDGQSLFPLHRVLEIAYDWEEVEKRADGL